MASRLAALGNVVAVDYSQQAVERAAKLYPSVRFECRDWLNANEPDWEGRFGLTVCSEVVEHIEVTRQQEFLARLAWTVKEGGHLIVTTPNGERATRIRDSTGGLYQPEDNYLSREQLTHFLQSAGLSIRSVQTATFLEKLWERSALFRRLRSMLRRSESPDLIDRMLRTTPFGMYLVVWAERPQ